MPVHTRSRRALLYMPGDSRRKIEKAAALDADCVCMDLEDGVSPDRKAAARAAVGQALAELDFGRCERLVRLNAYGSGLEADDLTATLPAQPDGFVLPKVEGAQALQWLDEWITDAEREHDWPAGSIGLIAIVETARGIVNLREICGASSRLRAVTFGAEDFAISVGATRTPEATEVLYARQAVVAHAAAFGLQAIDMARMEYQDEQALLREARQGASLGYTGKQAIHPSQVGPIQAAFTPDDEAIERARRIIQAYAEHRAAGVGAFPLEGRLVDAPVVRAAEQVLERARRAGKS